MHNFKIITNNEEISFNIENIKILYGNNYIKKRKMISNLIKVINKEQDSEYIKENNINTSILYDNNILNPNDFSIYLINNDFDIENDLKLGSKSLSLKYLELKMEEVEYNELFNTIKQLLLDFSNEYIEQNNISINNSNINYNINDFGLKQLVKLIEPIISEDNLKKNDDDLSYEEVIIYQLKLLSEIAQKSLKIIIIVIDNYITKNILDFINTMRINNLFVLINQNIRPIYFKVSDYVLVNKNVIDLDNEEQINEFIFNNLPFHIENENISILFSDYLNGKSSTNIIELQKQL